MNLELGRGGEPTKHTDRAPDMLWEVQSQHLAKILEKQSLVKDQLETTLRLKVMKDALSRALEKDDDELAADLAAGLYDANKGLGDAAPKTVADLDAREGLRDPGRMRTHEEVAHGLPPGTSGTAQDYMLQRLMGVYNIAQLVEQGKTITPPVLEESLVHEADRLATLLVAFMRAEGLQESPRAAAAK